MIGIARTSVLVLLFVLFALYIYTWNAGVVDNTRYVLRDMFAFFVSEENEEGFVSEDGSIHASFSRMRDEIMKYGDVTEEYGVALEKDELLYSIS
jgi:hypothetical protein